MKYSLSISVTAVASIALSYSVAAQADEVLEEVVVTATRTEQPISDVIGSVTVITRADIETSQAQSLQDLLRGEAGIDIANSGGLGKASSIYLRGGNATQTLILVDGVRMGSATAGTTSVEFIPVEQIERIEIVRGPRSSLYGSDAIGGVIQIFTRRNQGVTASAGISSHNTQDYSAGFGDVVGNLRFNVNGAYQQSDGFNACASGYSGGCYAIEPDKDGYRNSSGSAKLGYAFGEFADLELSTLYSQGRTEYDGSYVNETRFRNSAPSVRFTLNANAALSLTLSGGMTQDKNDNLNNGVFMSRFDTEKRNGSLQADWRIADAHTVTLGADYLQDKVDSDTAYTVTERDNKGLFAQYLGKFNAHEFSASLRRDDNQQFGGHTTGNVGWKWFALGKSLTLNAGAGSAFHAPTFNDLYYPWGYGNPELKPEQSKSYELGASGQLSWLDWSLQLYSTNVDNLIALDSSWYPGNISKARLRGAELTVDAQWQQLTAKLNYTAQDPRSRAAASYDNVLPHRSRQSGRVELSYDFGATQLSSTINVVGKRYDDLANSIELGGYTTVDVAAQVALSKQFTLQAKLGNFFDRPYETVRYYNQEGRTAALTVRYQMR